MNIEPVTTAVKESVSSLLGIGSVIGGSPRIWTSPGNAAASKQGSPDVPRPGSVFSRFW